MYKKVKTMHEAVACAVRRSEEWARLVSSTGGSADVLEIADAIVNEWNVHLEDLRMANFVHLREI